MNVTMEMRCTYNIMCQHLRKCAKFDIFRKLTFFYICDHVWINQPSTAKCKIWVQHKITARTVRSVFSLACRCNLRCVGYLVPQYEASTQYSLSRSDLKCHCYSHDGIQR